MTRFVSTLLTASMILLLVACSTAYAQTEPATSEEPVKSQTMIIPKFGEILQLEIKDQAESEAFRGLKLEKRFTRRLPNFFSQVVTTVQRDKIYDIQAAYFEPLEILTLRLERLKAERDAQIEAVLDANQKAKVEALVKDAAERRAANRAANATDADAN